MKSGCLESECFGVGGTWLNLCVVLPCIVVSLILGDKDRVRDDFIVKDRGWTRTTRRRIQVVEQEEDLRE